MNKIKLSVTTAFVSLFSFQALAGDPAPIPEPSVLPLLILGGLAIYFIRRKK